MSACTPIAKTRRLIAGVVALAYLLALPGLTPGALIVSGMLHGGHDVQVLTDVGHLDLVLHHQHAQDHHATLPGKQGGMVDDDDHDHDHVFHCASLDPTLSPAGALMRSPSLSFAVSVPPVMFSVPALPASQQHTLPLARPPPLASTAMLCLRTTVLLV